MANLSLVLNPKETEGRGNKVHDFQAFSVKCSCNTADGYLARPVARDCRKTRSRQGLSAATQPRRRANQDGDSLRTSQCNYSENGSGVRSASTDGGLYNLKFIVVSLVFNYGVPQWSTENSAVYYVKILNKGKDHFLLNPNKLKHAIMFVVLSSFKRHIQWVWM